VLRCRDVNSAGTIRDHDGRWSSRLRQCAEPLPRKKALGYCRWGRKIEPEGLRFSASDLRPIGQIGLSAAMLPYWVVRESKYGGGPRDVERERENLVGGLKGYRFIRRLFRGSSRIAGGKGRCLGVYIKLRVAELRKDFVSWGIVLAKNQSF